MKIKGLSGRLVSLCLIVVFIVSVSLLGCAAPAQQEEEEEEEVVKLTYANSNPETNMTTGIVPAEWAQRLSDRSDGRIQIHAVHGGALLAGDEMVEGVGKGVADLGSLYVGWAGGTMPITENLGQIWDVEQGPELGLIGTAVVNRELFKEFPEFRNEGENSGIKSVFGTMAGPYMLLFKEPVRTFEDLKGKKVRAFGTYSIMFLEAAGMEAVAMPAADVYTALSTGLVDGVYSMPSYMLSHGWHEQAPHIFIPALEGQIAPPIVIPTQYVIMNLDSWNSLDPDLQEIMEDVSNEMWTVGAEMVEENYFNALEDMHEEYGGEWHYLSTEGLNEWLEASPDWWELAVEEIEAAGLPGSEIESRWHELATAYIEGELE